MTGYQPATFRLAGWDRAISRRRAWAVRAVLGVVVVGRLAGTSTTGSVTGPFTLAGYVLGVAIVYLAALWALSTAASGE